MSKVSHHRFDSTRKEREMQIPPLFLVAMIETLINFTIT